MATATYDVIIIGGGINGAATAASVAARGYRTLVLEQDDFASGTTSASTKLIHGGLRYLETGDARLVHESLQSRERLLRERPHLVRPMGFILPVYEGDPRPPWYVRSGLALYDLLSPRKVSPWHSSFSERELQRFEPSISTDHLKAAFLYHYAQVWSPERLTLEYLA
ncbi:MAG: FAD-dependent oxidoreductase, partial [Chloroflexi bacterium]|nr:FAD-dependent oxidoreductase [Chloroflexota bacterium]